MQILVVLLCLKSLVTEVLHRLEIQQTIDGPSVGAVIQLITFPHKAITPFSAPDRKAAIQHHRTQHCQRIPGTEIDQQNNRNQANLNQCWQNIEHHEAQQKADPRGTALDIPCQTTSAARQVKAQIKPVQMLKHAQ